MADTSLTPQFDRRTRTRGDRRRRSGEVAWPAVFEALPVAALVIGTDGHVLAVNPAAAALLGPRATRGTCCCVLLGCKRPGAGGCAARLARTERGLAEARVELPGGIAVELAAMPVGAGGDVVVTLRRAAAAPGDGGGVLLRLHTLGRTRAEGPDGPLAEDWLGHRPGLVLKYLASERGRVVPQEELLDAFWPGGGRAGAANVRQAVHTLRDRLQPGRSRGDASIVVAQRGGYELAREHVWIDADDFESRARASLQALTEGAPAEAALLEAAAAYGGDFLADEPYAEWALPERERLRDLAAQVLRALADLKRAAGDLDGAGEHLQRLADLEPLDLGAQRDLIGLLIRRGRHSEALRRYELVRRRHKRAFGDEPGFTLADAARP